MPEQTHTILIVDDEQNMRVALFEALSRNGHDVAVAENGQMALEMIARHPPDLVVTDIKMPGMDGLELLRQVKALRPELPVVIMTGFATVDTAVEAMKQGAFDYLLKPFPVEVIEETVARVFALASKLPQPSAKPAGQKAGEVASLEKPIIGKSPKLLQLMARARSVASSKATVLILGESGTGKEVFARFIHNESDRRNGPFVALNCAALPEGLLESELFGHEKGAFTGAHALKRGRFERAQGGTIFLDEIGELSPEAQVRLLRVLQDREVERVGGSGPIQVDIRVLAATHRALEAMVASGRFREDLYYRLRVFPVRIPPLRERRSDIPALVDYFIRKKCLDLGRPESPGLASGALDRILAHDWPGNVRELEHAVERELIIRQGALLMFADLESTALGPERADRLADSDDLDLDMVMARHIEQVLQRTNGRVEGERGAARLLGVNPGTLRYRMRKLGVPFGRKGRDR